MFIRALISNTRRPLTITKFKWLKKRDSSTEVQYNPTKEILVHIEVESVVILLKKDYKNTVKQRKDEFCIVGKTLSPIAVNCSPSYGFLMKRSDFAEAPSKAVLNHKSPVLMDTIYCSTHRSLHQGPQVNHETLRFCSKIQMQPKTQYDIISEKYLQIRSKLKVVEVLEYTLYKQLNFQHFGHRVIDLACGNGVCTRAVKKLGAGKIVGVDISKEMIAKALYEEKMKPLGIEYIAASVDEMKIESETFDIATAFFLLNYAENKKQLGAFLKNIYSVLRKGGTFISTYNNIEECFCIKPRYLEKYGFIFKIQEPLQSGSQVILTLGKGDVNIDLIIYHYTQEDYREAAKMAGFTEVDFLPLEFPEHMKGVPYWKRLHQHNPALLLVCKK